MPHTLLPVLEDRVVLLQIQTLLVHITAEYAKTLAPALREPLADALNTLDKK